MNEICPICDNAGTVRDGNPCPRCSVSRWAECGAVEEVARPKRTVWVQSARTPVPNGSNELPNRCNR